jgi:hypothetical protein
LCQAEAYASEHAAHFSPCGAAMMLDEHALARVRCRQQAVVGQPESERQIQKLHQGSSDEPLVRNGAQNNPPFPRVKDAGRRTVGEIRAERNQDLSVL